jgi:hypothetical protein
MNSCLLVPGWVIFLIGVVAIAVPLKFIAEPQSHIVYNNLPLYILTFSTSIAIGAFAVGVGLVQYTYLIPCITVVP